VHYVFVVEGVSMLETSSINSSKAGHGVVRIAQSLQRSLLFVAPPGMISDCLFDAIEHEFPGVSIAHVADLHMACAACQHPTALVFIDAAFLNDIDMRYGDLSRHHPSASIVLMYDQSWHSKDAVGEVLFSKTIRSVLPMNLKLDLWLSVIRLLLRGGEYFPPSLLQARFDSLNSGGPGATKHSGNGLSPTGDGGTNAEGLKDLTGREMEILEMVSRGYQNKVIAANFNLSEHTVKVHLHHIIKKLGTHNRTSAAAIFLKNPDALGTSSRLRGGSQVIA
jgi:DNA-binding NarL/FixJ family response regulator